LHASPHLCRRPGSVARIRRACAGARAVARQGLPGAQNVALWTGLARGTFLKHGVAVDLQFTQTSPELRDGLASGAVDVAHAAADNAIAMVEVAKHDVVLVMGGDSSMNEFFVQPDVATLADMRGRTLTVDAPNTAYALQGMKILKNAGVMPDQYKVKVTGGTFQRGKAMIESKENAALDAQPAVFVRGGGGGAQEHGPRGRPDRSLPGVERVRDALMGREERAAARALRRRLRRGAALGDRPGESRGDHRAARTTSSSSRPSSPRRPTRRSSIRSSARPPTPSSTSRACATCSRSARSSPGQWGACRRRRRSTSSSARTSAGSRGSSSGHSAGNGSARSAAPCLPAPLARGAETRRTTARVGFLAANTPEVGRAPIAAFQRALHERGWIEGRN
jgi:hypothetical protein